MFGTGALSDDEVDRVRGKDKKKVAGGRDQSVDSTKKGGKESEETGDETQRHRIALSERLDKIEAALALLVGEVVKNKEDEASESKSSYPKVSLTGQPESSYAD